MDRHHLIVGREQSGIIEWYDPPRKVDALNIGHVWLLSDGRAKLVIDHPFYNLWFREVTDEYRENKMTYNPSFVETKPNDQIQCQTCGGVIESATYALPKDCTADSTGLWHCKECWCEAHDDEAADIEATQDLASYRSQ